MEEKYKKQNKMDFNNLIKKRGRKEYDVYIVGDIVEDYTNYVPLHDLLRKGGLTINFIIKTYGGDMYSSLTIRDMIRECKSKTTAHIFTARSGGAVIALACDKIRLYPSSSMMIHEPQLEYPRNNLSQLSVYVDYIREIHEEVLTDYCMFDKDIKKKLAEFKEVCYTKRMIEERIKDTEWMC